MKKKNYLFLALIQCILLDQESKAIENWSNWLGPNYDGSIEGNLVFASDHKKIKTRWEVPVGTGWSSPVKMNQKVFLHDRIKDKENLTAYNIDSGKIVWKFSFNSSYRDDFGMENGPRSTPSISQGIIVSHSPDGLLHAVNTQNGKLRWKKDLFSEFGSPKGFFGRCSHIQFFIPDTNFQSMLRDLKFEQGLFSSFVCFGPPINF